MLKGIEDTRNVKGNSYKAFVPISPFTLQALNLKGQK